MKGIVSTKQIYFRPVSIDDIDNGWLDWINDPTVNKFLVHKKPTRHNDLVKYLDESQPPSVYMFAVCLVDNDQYVGNVRLSSIDWVNRHASYGRLIGNGNMRGRGIGTEVLILLLYYSFYLLNLNRVFSGVIANNIASIRSNEKAGLVREGVLKESAYINGAYEDSIIFGLTRKDFDNTGWEKVVISHSINE